MHSRVFTVLQPWDTAGIVARHPGRVAGPDPAAHADDSSLFPLQEYSFTLFLYLHHSLLVHLQIEWKHQEVPPAEQRRF